MTNYYWCHLHFHQYQLADSGPSYKCYQRELFTCHQITLFLLYLTINMVRYEVKKSLLWVLQQCLPSEVNLPFSFRVCLVPFSLILFFFKIVLDQLFLLLCRQMLYMELVKLFKFLVDFNRFNSGIFQYIIKTNLLLRIVVPKYNLPYFPWIPFSGSFQTDSATLLQTVYLLSALKAALNHFQQKV